MAGKSKKPISITLAAAVILCIITFISGFLISSFAFLDSRLEEAGEKNAELKETISAKEEEIRTLKAAISEKDSNNIILGEKIQSQLDTIDNLNAQIGNLENDVTSISQAAIDGGADSSFFRSFSKLTFSQQLILLILLLVIIIFVISVTCGIIASGRKPVKRVKPAKSPEDPSSGLSETPAASDFEEENAPSDETESENDTYSPIEAEPSHSPAPENSTGASSGSSLTETPSDTFVDKTISSVTKAIQLLYTNRLEENISSLNGFKFGITNFDDILSDRAVAKSFGNSENGDFVAFMSNGGAGKKMYVIPRYSALSDSTVALRGTSDLFDIINESGDVITHGSIKIKSVDSPAVFSCGASGWSISSKGKIVALGTKALM